MNAPGWYYRLSQFFKEKFGERVFKIPLDAGFTCPNRDGAISLKGCAFCFNPAFSPAAAEKKMGGEAVNSIQKQIRLFQWRTERKKLPGPVSAADNVPPSFVPQRLYLAYFQTFSNTYGPLSFLEQVYAGALQMPGIVGLSIATRPDCLEGGVLDLLSDIARRSHIWLELGLQTAHDSTLKLINRGHDFACFQEAVQACRGRNLYICVHLINGLPGESPSHMLETARRLSFLPVHGVKFHQLQVLAGTALEHLYRKGHMSLLSLEEYLQVICNQLEALPAGVTVHRLLAETPRRDLLIAPDWGVSRTRFAVMVEEELRRRGTCQGSRVLAPG